MPSTPSPCCAAAACSATVSASASRSTAGFSPARACWTDLRYRSSRRFISTSDSGGLGRMLDRAALRQARVEGAERLDDRVGRVAEEPRIDAIGGIGRLVIVRVVLDAEVDEWNPRLVERGVVRRVRPVVQPPAPRLGAVVPEQESDRGAALDVEQDRCLPGGMV